MSKAPFLQVFDTYIKKKVILLLLGTKGTVTYFRLRIGQRKGTAFGKIIRWLCLFFLLYENILLRFMHQLCHPV